MVIEILLAGGVLIYIWLEQSEEHLHRHDKQGQKD